MELNSAILAIFGVSVFGVLVKLLAYSKARKGLIERRLKKLEEANLAMLHDSIYEKCSHYIEQGFISVDDLDNLEYLFSGYSGLGGNGTGETLYNKVKELPIRKIGG
ncbi:hypothetical protein CI088_00380 [Enterococcus plantarum]|uniref:Uncharacterized protein n=1 Tax=Enterococcus plantarum TaxID=1077675 RepID=A0A2W3ZLQ0_9ENTE|nr:hypothetical protein CI088_00380 [Enterococcus plantarum]